MPKNLNALIRYKTIDIALRNRSVPCTRQRMMELCTEALGEYKGQYKFISERTIYDDLRVMKSEILGYNAPIEQKNGVYRYADDDFVLFKLAEGDLSLMKDTINFLIKNKLYLPYKETDELINRIAEIVGYPIPMDKYTGEVIPVKPFTGEMFKELKVFFLLQEINKYRSNYPKIEDEIKTMSNYIKDYQGS